MSSVICIQTYDRVWVGADSAVSAQINGKVYRLHEQGKKLFQVDDMVIFCSGIMELAASIMEEFEATEDRTLETLQNIARKQCADYTAEHPEVESRGGLFADMLIAVYDKERGKTVVYSISPYHNDFEIVERTLNSSMDFAIWAGGIRTQQATDAAMLKFRQTLNVNFALKYAFRAISYEGIGGDLTVYEIDAGGVRKSLQHKIREKPGIRRLTRDVLDKVVAELIVAESVVGQLGDFVSMKIGTGNNVTMINTNGIAAGHATFSSAPFQVKMNGDVIARSITLTGKISQSTMESSTLTGNLIRTAASGARVEIDHRGWRTFDANGRERISINANDTYGMSAISFARSNGSAAGYINGGDSIFQITSLSDMMFAAVNGWIYFQGNLDFSRANSVYGLTAAKIDGLSSLLNTKVNRGEPTTSATGGSHNHGFPNGTQFKDVNGQVHTWSSYSGFTHSHTV
ncbi:hypothetical protein YSY43_15690 [Paenibacillus sp. YSY-4.3]